MDGSDLGLKHAPNPSKEVEDIRQRPGEEPSLLPGDLGYRTRLVYPGLWYSGLDPLDTACESGRLLGQFLHKLFGGQIRTHSPALLAAMAVLGLLAAFPAVYAAFAFGVAGYVDTRWLMYQLMCLMPLAAIGITLLLCVARNATHRV